MAKTYKFAFLKSVRFWKLGLAGLSAGIVVFEQTQNILLAVAAVLGFWATGDVAVRTYDKAHE